jgi:hypothetical protein
MRVAAADALRDGDGDREDERVVEGDADREARCSAATRKSG